MTTMTKKTRKEQLIDLKVEKFHLIPMMNYTFIIGMFSPIIKEFNIKFSDVL